MFDLKSNFKPSGDQPKAIKSIINNFDNVKEQILLGATGTGKTFTVANIISEIKKPTLILAHNKTLAAQLYTEFKEFFPNNAVEYFVSYYDYFQPEAYIPGSDTFIEKDASINDEIDRLRHSTTSSLIERDDVIVISSVSCIYGIGNPIQYKKHTLSLRENMTISREEIIRKLIDMQYERNDFELKRNTFRVRGDLIEIIPSNNDNISYRIEMFDDEIESISEINTITSKKINKLKHIALFPSSHFVTEKEVLDEAILEIKKELKEQIDFFKKENKLIEAQRIEQRVNYDIEMMEEMGFCSGIENYSRFLERRARNTTPTTLFDYFPEDFLMIIDESHVTVPQIGAMYGGDKSRKDNLIDFGFRLPSASDNRPLKFSEFEQKKDKVLYVSATPGKYELELEFPISEQVIRPTGLLDPLIEVVKTENQIDDIIDRINKCVERNERVLITTLTKKMAEDLNLYLSELNIKVDYLHSDIKTLERTEVLNKLRSGVIDVLIGINLLREGLDLPEVSTVIILDADKEGFLRSDRSLIQTIGRAARNSNGLVILYADKITKSMDYAIKETERRRKIQIDYNIKNNIVPKTIIKNNKFDIKIKEEILSIEKTVKNNKKDKEKYILELEKKMKKAAKDLDFELAANIRDQILDLKK